MPKKVKGLTAAKVKSITKSGDYADGNGLYLRVTNTGQIHDKPAGYLQHYDCKFRNFWVVSNT